LLQELLKEAKFRKATGVVLKIYFEKFMIRSTRIFCLIVANRKVSVRNGWSGSNKL
jgi:hypothetical protein